MEKTTHEVECCIVGGGPAGLVLALLMARKGVETVVLEAHRDFDRDFRGDTVHPSTLEVMDRLGLAERLLELPHTKLDHLSFRGPAGVFTMANLRRLRTKFPYIALMPQSRFLDFLAGEIAKYPCARILLGTNVQELLTDGDRIAGVRFQSETGHGEILARLVVATDGRFSRLRKLVGFQPVASSPPMDVLWFRLPMRAGDTAHEIFRLGGGHMLIVLDRDDHWQLGYVIMKGSFKALKEAGIERFRRSLAELVPELADRVDVLTDWKEITPLSVESSRLPRWHRPGLLFLGDAAHVMSPVGGVGINVAIQDAVVAANMLARPLKDGTLSESDLARVQKKRMWPTRVIQTLQSAIQERIVRSALTPNGIPRPPFILRLPFLRDIPARMIAFGVSHALPEV